MIEMSDNKEQIEKIISNTGCQRGFKCYKSDFTDLCKVRDIGIDSFVECLLWLKGLDTSSLSREFVSML